MSNRKIINAASTGGIGYYPVGNPTDAYYDNVSLLLTGDVEVDSNFANVSLLLDGNTLTDKSNNKATITNTGSVTISSTVKKFGTGSMAFNGSNYLTVPSNSVFSFGTGDFTVEAWVYRNAASGTYETIFGFDTSGQLLFQLYQNQLDFGIRLTTSNLSGVIVPINTWVHLAISRQSGIVNYFQNGVLIYTYTGAYATQNFTNSSQALVGCYSTAAGYWNGYIDDLRITKGVARYTSNFTPPVKALPTHEILDSSVYRLPVTASGAIAIDTTTKKFGTGAISRTNGGFAYIPSNSVFSFGANDFTVEFWFMQTSVGSTGVVGKWNSAGGASPTWSEWLFTTYNSTSAIDFWVGDTDGVWGMAMISTTTDFTTWKHIAATRSGSTWRLFVNGMVESTVTSTRTIQTGDSPLRIGAWASGGTTGNFRIDDLRITKGYARYTANFTPPSAVSGVVLGYAPTVLNAPFGVVDNLNDTGFILASGGSEYFVYDFGSVVSNISSISFYSSYAGGGRDRVMQIQTSNDNSTFTNLATVNYSTSGGGEYLYSLPSFSARYVKVYATNTGGSHTPRTATVKFYPTVVIPTASLPTIPPAISADPWWGNVSLLLDGNTTDVYDPYWQNVSLMLTGDDFIDWSNQHNAVTNNGTVTLSTATKKFNSSSLAFNGSNYLTMPMSSIGTGNFTLEFWCKPTNNTVAWRGIVDFRATAGSDSGIGIFQYGTELSFYGNGLKLAIANTLNTAWIHVAIARNGMTITVYLNGNSIGTFTSSLDYTSTSISIGAGKNTTEAFVGQIADLRITKGVARPITVPTAALPSYKIQDRTQNNLTVTPYGNVKLSTDVMKNGTGSMFFDGTGDYLTVTDTSNLLFGTSDFTIECWFMQNSAVSDSVLVTNAPSNTWSANYFLLHVNHSAHPNKFSSSCYNINSTAQYIYGTTDIVNGKWYHVALVRSGSTFNLYVNGILEGTANSTANVDGSTLYTKYIGGVGNATLGINGYIDDLRITKGYARYTQNFTPPSQSFATQYISTGYDANYADVSLLLNGNGTNGSTTFTDLSSGNNAITVLGSAQISTSIKKYGTGSVYLPSGSNALHVTLTSPLTINSSDDFTIECWVYITAFTPVNTIYNTGSIYEYLAVRSSGTILEWSTIVGSSTSFSYTFSLNTWYHIALVRTSGNTVKCFVNGTQAGTNYTYSGAVITTTPVRIGYYLNSPNSLNGYMDDLRITKGVARYTANFTPPTYQLPTDTTGTVIDPLRSSTSLLLRGNGTNGSTSFTDESPNGLTVTTAGTSQVSTSIKKYGTGAIYSPAGLANYISVPGSAINFGTNPFTIEFWIYYDNTGNGYGAEAFGFGGGNNTSPMLGIGYPSAGKIFFGVSFASIDISPTDTVPINIWTHIAISRDSNSLTRMFINGVLVGSATMTSNFTSNTDFNIGHREATGPNSIANRYIDDFRVTKGYARYTSNFTPPTYEDPIVTGTVYDYNYPQVSLLLNGDGTNGSQVFKDLSGSPKTITVNGTAQISTAQKKFGTGSMAFDGTGDYLSVASLPLNIAQPYTIEYWMYLATTTSMQIPFSNGGGAGSWSQSNGHQILFYYSSSALYCQYNYGNAAVPIVMSASSISTLTWYHVAVTYDGTTTRLFVNGASQSTSTNTPVRPTTYNLTYVGYITSADASYFNGYIDDLRVTQGLARYTQNFTPPTAPLPTSYS